MSAPSKGIFLFILILSLILIIPSIPTMLGCGDDEEDNAGTTDDGTTDDGITDDVVSDLIVSFAQAFPPDLILASPTAALPGALPAFLKLEEAPLADGEDYLSKKEALTTMLEPTSVNSCSFNFSLVGTAGTARCYGPGITFDNYPNDGDEGACGGGDLGIWYENEINSDATATDQACSSAQLNAVINGISTKVNSVISMMASLVCIADVNELEIPGVGEELDLTTEVSDAYTSIGIGVTLSSVLFSRAEDDTDGNPVFVTNLEGQADSGGATYDVSCRLKHIALDEDNATYRGKLSCVMSSEGVSAEGNCGEMGSNTSGSTEAISISYEKSSETSIVYELNSGAFCGANADPYESATNYTVDKTKTVATAVDGWGGNFKYGIFETDPTTGLGEFHYAWQAGYGDSNTRALNGSISSTDGDVTGELYFGYGPSMSEGPTTIEGMFCNWGCGGAGGNPAIHTDLVQRQTLITNDAGTFIPDESNIEFAVTTTCTHNKDNFTWEYQGSAAAAMPGNPTHDLYDISLATFASPTAPTDVDE